MQYHNDITYFAHTNFRDQKQRFGIRQADRLLHTYIIGKTGTGKSTLIETKLMQDIHARRGVCLLDPHGDLVEKIANQIPKERKNDLVYFNVPNRNLDLRYNPLKNVSYEKRSLVASSIIEVFAKLWKNAWGVKLEHILRYTLLTLLDQPNATLADIPKLLLEKEYRYRAVQHVINPEVKSFWKREFPRYMHYDLLPVLNKIGGMLAHPVIKRVFIENTEEISLRKIMDEKKILLVNLSKGHLGEDVAHLIGALLVTSLGSATFSRVDTPEHNRIPFMIYLDEFHNFTTLSLVNMFSEMRKFKVGMILAHQYLHQLDDKIRRAILGNIGTLITFRIGVEDAQYIAKEMYPTFGLEDCINLPNYSIYLKLMIDGVPSKAFSATTFI